MDEYLHTGDAEILKKLTIKDFKNFFKERKMTYTYSSREKYIQQIKKLEDYYKFPWRKDQYDVITKFFSSKEPYFVVNGIFGCGKTTMLLGIVLYAIIEKYYDAEELMFISFNVCIRDELKSKLRKYGLKSLVKVRTFDSLIYEMCKNHSYKYMDIPNYDGKRIFIYDKCREEEVVMMNYEPKLILIDEVQDFKRKDLDVLKKFYPNSRIIFAGDIFQSIQREPRESLLWYLLQQDNDKIFKFYMKETPRVPQKILQIMKKTLTEYYPEMEEKIVEWTSSNTHSDQSIFFDRIYNYSQIFKKIRESIDKYGPENLMLLTFSSAITVKGAMGDVARLRRHLLGEGVDVNKNHKRIEEGKVFLSTANSSKGLERDYVVIFLTFPLEKAFANFSEDIVMNLLTVAITRARKKVIFYVPAYPDKFSNVLHYYDMCPKPNKEKVREGKLLKEFTFKDYTDIEVCVTEMIKQNIVTYDTRIDVKESIKMYQSDKIFDSSVGAKRPIRDCEEERAFVGILIENLITSTWCNKWPEIVGIQNLKNHPMYTHCYKRIESGYMRYCKFTKTGSMENLETHFKGIYLYTQVHVAVYNKIFINFGDEILEGMKNYWRALKPKIIHIRPEAKKLFIQANMRMPWVTGVADAIFTNEKDELNLWELKASVSPEWKDDALTQVFLYSLMSGKAWSRLTLLNPFRNEKCIYYFNSKKIMTLRNKVYKDVLTWNFNCYLAKNYNKRCKKVFPIDNKVFLCKREDDKGLVQVTLIEFLSPTKMLVKNHIHFKREYGEGKKLNRLEKISKESEIETSDSYLEKYKTYEVLDCDKELKEFIEIPETSEKLQEKLEYVKNSELKYCLDFNDTLVRVFSLMILLSKDYRLI